MHQANFPSHLFNFQMHDPAAKRFWYAIDALVNSSEIVIDRPAKSTHPNYPKIIYPYDYGYLKNTQSPDGKEIDIWRGSLTENKATAVICTVDLEKRDSEIKILIGCNQQEIQTIAAFHDEASQSRLVKIRE